ncbi:MAG: hypothetical protein K9I71_12730 [Ignavibacteriales bacterium]|nr:hypothetical protein [Ignavibacteriales bacterium]MCF8438543.1 hypothetical protein [Ignavibacteriales bacterium]
MKYKLIVRPEAESDISEAVKWYEERLKGLGLNFLVSLDATIESILRMPESYTTNYKNTRRALVRKFPFGVHYIIDVCLPKFMTYVSSRWVDLSASNERVCLSLIEPKF